MSTRCYRVPYRLRQLLCRCRRSRIKSIHRNRPNKIGLHALDATIRRSPLSCGHGTLALPRVDCANRTISANDHVTQWPASCRCHSISNPSPSICEHACEYRLQHLISGWRMVEIWWVNAYNVANAWPLFGSHNLIGCWLSLLPDTIKAFCGCQWTHFTSAPWPLSTRSSWHRKKSNTRSVPSSLQLTNLLSDGLKLHRQMHRPQKLIHYSSELGMQLISNNYLMPRIGSLCAWNMRTLFMFDCQYFTKPVWSPVTIQLSLCDQTIVRTGLSWACVNKHKITWMSYCRKSAKESLIRVNSLQAEQAKSCGITKLWNYEITIRYFPISLIA